METKTARIRDRASWAVQLVFECSDWDDGHIDEFWRLIQDENPGVFSSRGAFVSECYAVLTLMKKGLSHNEAFRARVGRRRA